MVFFANADGTVTNVVTEPVHQGSANANRVIYVAPFAQSSTVDVAFALPSGIVTVPVVMTPHTFEGTPPEIAGVSLSAWSASISAAVTEVAGTVTVQFRAYNGSGQILASSATTFVVSPGVLQIPPDEPPDDENASWESMATAIAKANEDLGTVSRDLANVSDDLANVSDDLANHEEKVASDSSLGHVMTHADFGILVESNGLIRTDPAKFFDIVPNGSSMPDPTRAEYAPITPNMIPAIAMRMEGQDLFAEEDGKLGVDAYTLTKRIRGTGLVVENSKLVVEEAIRNAPVGIDALRVALNAHEDNVCDGYNLGHVRGGTAGSGIAVTVDGYIGTVPATDGEIADKTQGNNPITPSGIPALAEAICGAGLAYNGEEKTIETDPATEADIEDKTDTNKPLTPANIPALAETLADMLAGAGLVSADGQLVVSADMATDEEVGVVSSAVEALSVDLKSHKNKKASPTAYGHVAVNNSLGISSFSGYLQIEGATEDEIKDTNPINQTRHQHAPITPSGIPALAERMAGDGLTANDGSLAVEESIRNAPGDISDLSTELHAHEDKLATATEPGHVRVADGTGLWITTNKPGDRIIAIKPADADNITYRTGMYMPIVAKDIPILTGSIAGDGLGVTGGNGNAVDSSKGKLFTAITDTATDAKYSFHFIVKNGYPGIVIEA